MRIICWLVLWFSVQPFGIAVTNKPMRVQVQKIIAKEHRVILNVTGMTVASRDVTLRAKIEGIVKEVHVKYGEQVKKGDILVELDPEDRLERLKEAEARVEQRKKEYESAEILLKKKVRSFNQVMAQKAELHAAEARQAEIKLEIRDSKIIAPFDGINESRDVEEGEIIKSGDAIARVIELHPLRVDCFVSENDVFDIINQLGKQDIAKVKLNSNPTLHPAKITFVSKNANTRTRTYRVELEIDNQDYEIPAGLTTSVQIVKQSIKAHKISLASITLSDERIAGVKVVQNNKVKFIPIKIIDADKDGSVWITGPANEAILITIGAGYVIDGQVVESAPIKGKTL